MRFSAWKNTYTKATAVPVHMPWRSTVAERLIETYVFPAYWLRFFITVGGPERRLPGCHESSYASDPTATSERITRVETKARIATHGSNKLHQVRTLDEPPSHERGKVCSWFEAGCVESIDIGDQLKLIMEPQPPIGGRAIVISSLYGRFAMSKIRVPPASRKHSAP